MNGRHLFAFFPMACLLALGVPGIAPVANAESGAQAAKPGKSVRHNVAGTKRRFRSTRIHLPIGPGSVYHDYPYYYCRGYYPRHIGGYVYYPYAYYDRSCHYRDYGRGPGSAHWQKARRK
jgi:hypothetical protein